MGHEGMGCEGWDTGRWDTRDRTRVGQDTRDGTPGPGQVLPASPRPLGAPERRGPGGRERPRPCLLKGRGARRAEEVCPAPAAVRSPRPPSPPARHIVAAAAREPPPEEPRWVRAGAVPLARASRQRAGREGEVRGEGRRSRPAGRAGGDSPSWHRPRPSPGLREPPLSGGGAAWPGGAGGCGPGRRR